MYLKNQFVSLFSNIFVDQSVVFRIIDNFLLEGKGYIFKTCLAII